MDDVYKGSVARTAIVLAVRRTPSCGFGFTTGRRYLVYASTDQDDPSLFTTGICSGTRLLDAAAPTAVLGPPREPVAGGPSMDDYAAGPTLTTAVLTCSGLGALLLPVATAWVLMRWRRTYPPP